MEARNVPGAIASPVRVMLVDDSAVIRGIMRRWIDAERGLDVVASAINGQEAIAKAKRVQPDIIILDLEMPVMSGMEALPELRKVCAGAKILIASTLTTRNARASLAAMRAGATDYLAKPDVATSRDAFRLHLVEKLRALGGDANAMCAVESGNVVGLSQTKKWRGSMKALAVGASTGGPQAINEVFGTLSGKFDDCAVFVTQHMPAHFTKLLGEDLAQRIGLPGGEAVEGEPVLPGRLYMAPGGFHMRVVDNGGKLRIELGDEAAINFCKPSVDPTFFSVARHYQGDCAAVMLTGMGHDGARGAKAIHDGGGVVLAQDQATSAVWGMPGAAIAANAVDRVLQLQKIGPELLRLKG
ncbi:chemotaxis-specific protein-glutamate methyltransferase CheB [Maritalea porphyrae]|uniref:Protein-glutamate methylesterase/protein-glutamine glutaminase n=1 Tax=Maritalea porphyrae TaxID=880732 RepID=A0ABQ5UNE9_9HYPH|nr:chemotaxis-specific protein-glutamate methyltransferase CheB [Maritalea porphyrae]GLQ16187.1 chemotaxis response regulator protein-glutamate methylesterase of group 2 operon [Maritalea porphyrae]